MPAGKGAVDDDDGGPPATTAQVHHPLDPLTGAEIGAATGILKRDRQLKDSARFVYVTLREPGKDTVLRHEKGSR